jgi:hypothetical protein
MNEECEFIAFAWKIIAHVHVLSPFAESPIVIFRGLVLPMSFTFTLLATDHNPSTHATISDPIVTGITDVVGRPTRPSRTVLVFVSGTFPD